MASFSFFVVYIINKEGDFIKIKKCEFCNVSIQNNPKKVYQYILCDKCFNSLTDLDFKELEYRTFEENYPETNR